MGPSRYGWERCAPGRRQRSGSFARSAHRADVAATYAPTMRDSVTVHMTASADEICGLVSDITNTGRFSPETSERVARRRGPTRGRRSVPRPRAAQRSRPGVLDDVQAPRGLHSFPRLTRWVRRGPAENRAIAFGP